VFEEELKRLTEEGLLRRVLDRASAQGARVPLEGREMVNFASNDYLGLAAHPALAEAARRAIGEFGLGAGASRLLAGGSAPHAELERRTAEFKGAEAALLFNSGYAANAGILPALAGEGDALFSDELNHASLVDGCRLSRAKTFVYRHGEAGHLEELLAGTRAGRKVVATDSVFSMDGDLAPLEDIYELCLKHGAILYIDDAHATGVLGGGRGSLAHFSLRPGPWVVQMGTYSKALGSFGAFAAGEKGATSWLLNSARSLIYSTALPACVAAASLAALKIVENDPARIERLWKNREILLSGLKEMGLDTGASETPIIPIIMKSVPEAVELSERLRREGVYAPAIRPPTVREPRLRLSVTAAHSAEDIERLLNALKRKA
jgi:8-amino-7-oxononanoate synthase